LKAKGRVERYCFAVAKGQFHAGALVVDLVGDEVPPEDLEEDTAEDIERRLFALGK